jgi:hypothetical protein
MSTRTATHAEAVYVARTLNVHIETVWHIIAGMSYANVADLELAVHEAFLQHGGAMGSRGRE